MAIDKVRAFIMGIILGLNLGLIYILIKVGWFIPYISFGLGLVIGLLLNEGVSDFRDIMGILTWIFFWPFGFVIFMLTGDIQDRLRRFWFKVRYRLFGKPVFDLEKKIRNTLEDEFDIDGYLHVDVYILPGKLKVTLDDYDILTDNEDIVRKKISEVLRISEDRIVISWTDEWRYDMW